MSRLARALRDFAARTAGNETEVTAIAHANVLRMIDGVSAILPPDFNRVDIAEIIRPKAADYYSELEDVVQDYWLIKRALQRYGVPSGAAARIARASLSWRRARSSKRSRDKLLELDLPADDVSPPPSIGEVARGTDVLFFASMQTYLRVVALYFAQAHSLRYSLVVPRRLANAKVLEAIPSDRLLFFRGFPYQGQSRPVSDGGGIRVRSVR